MEPSTPPLVSAPLPSPERAPKETFAEQFGRDLTARARQGKLPPVIGREREIQQVVEILLAQFKPNPLLIGEPGVGKTAIVEGFAQRIVEGKVPEPLRETRVVEVQLGALVAGASIQGELEGRIRRLIEEAENNAHLILFLDELHLVNDPRYGGIVGNMLKPKLARGSLRVIGACTYRDYKAHLETDEALTRRFQVVLVNEPTEEQAIEMLKGLRPYLQQHHEVAIPDEVIEEAVRLSVRYFPDRFLPDKAIDLIDQACARLRVKATESALQAPCDREDHAENQREVSGNGTDLDG
jgi:ATP-dependent Clp protease ATP-binding subunit ClpA